MPDRTAAPPFASAMLPLAVSLAMTWALPALGQSDHPARSLLWSSGAQGGLRDGAGNSILANNPFPRLQHTAIYDPIRNRMLVFGGLGSSDLNDTWALSLGDAPAWSVVVPTGVPPDGRFGHTAIYDPLRDRMLVFGGESATGPRNDVWALSLGDAPAWSEIVPTGVPPSGRYGHSAIYDPVGDRMLVFGGQSDTAPYTRDDLWALSLGDTPAWSLLVPAVATPPSRYHHTAICDLAHNRMLVFGGIDGSGLGERSDVWALSLGDDPTWIEVVPNGAPVGPRAYHTAVYDPVRDRMVVFGGSDRSGSRQDTWALSLGVAPGWSEVLPSGVPPESRNSHTAIYDPIRDRMLVFGGIGSSIYDESWALSLGEAPAWSLLAPVGAPPSIQSGNTAILDPLRDRMLVLGGNRRNGIWSLSLGDAPVWSEIVPSGPLPGPRRFHTAIYDPVRDRMLVFGGDDGSGANLRNDVWALSLAETPTWSEIVPSGALPEQRHFHTAIYDPIRDRMLVFGGLGASGYLDDTWALSLGDAPVWTEIVPSGTAPTSRYGHTAIYDPLGDRMLVFGGHDIDDLYHNDTWALSLGGAPEWTELTPAGIPPDRRAHHTAVYDRVRERMLVFGGILQDEPWNDIWALSLTGDPAWSEIVPAGAPQDPEYQHTAIADSARDRMVVFGGYGGYAGSTPNEARALYLSGIRGCLGSPAWGPLAAPSITLASSKIGLPAVTVGDTVSSPFCLGNSGSDSLSIAAIELPSPDFHLSNPAPFMIQPNGAITENLQLVARTPGDTAVDLFIDSNDATTVRSHIAVKIRVLALEYQSHLLSPAEQAPLGVPIVDLVKPASGVRIEQGHLFYRAAGTTGAFNQVSFAPSAGDFVAVIPGTAVGEAGLEYYVEMENSGFVTTDPPGAPRDSIFFQAVGSPDSFTALPRPTSASDFLEGRDILVEVQLPTAASFESGAIHYRQGGEQSYKTDTLATSSVLGKPVATIPDSLVGPRGVEYWVEVRTLTRRITFPRDTSAAPATIRTKVQNLIEPTAQMGGRYRMLAAPLDFGADFSGSLDAILTDQLGTYDPTNWRAFRYIPETRSYLEVSQAAAAGGKLRPEPGRAFWLIAKNPYRIDTAPVAGRSTPTDAPFPVALAPGWNQFGNPFDFPVAWDSVRRNSAVVGNPVAFDASRGTIGDYADGTPTALKPFEGYFIENTSTDPETLWVPPIEDPIVIGAPAPTPATSSDGWSVHLAAQTDRASDGANVLGVEPGAADEYDALDEREPPTPPGPWVSLSFANPEWREKPGRYRRDVRSPGDGHAWELEILSATPGEPVTLAVADDGALPRDLALTLVDREQSSSVALRAGGGAMTGTRITSLGPDRPYRLTLLAGSAAYVARAAKEVLEVPKRLVLEQNAPNPFGATTRIRFGLPRAEPVTLEVYDVGGARVASLVPGTALTPGYHTAFWDGTNGNGRAAASGMYFFRLVTPSGAFTRRLVIVR